MARIRVEDTFSGLCKDCKYAGKYKAEGQNRQYVYCSSFERVVPPMEICGRYRHRNFVELYDMNKLAWEINTDKKQEIGFRSPKDIAKDKSDDRGDYEKVQELERLLPQKLRDL